MIDYPYLKEQPSGRQVVAVFQGLNRNTRIGQGEFSEMENMTSDHYPVLSPRGKRGRVGQASKPEGMYYVSGVGTFLIDNGRLQFIDEDGRPFVESNEEGSFRRNTRHRFALMGKNLIIAPDMRWVNIENPTVSYSIGEKWEVTTGKITVSLCDQNGNRYENVQTSPEAPANPGNQALWLDSSQKPRVLMRYTALTEEWTAIPTVYARIDGLGEHHFNAGDGVEISGLTGAAYSLNGSHVLQKIGNEDIVVIGSVDEAYEQNCAENPVTIERKVPELDFILESGNRLWGCKADVNEIYACKLGDFHNWNVFSGLSTDSWVGNVGSSGRFTGAVNHGGYPVFYKDTMKHKIWPSSTGAHQISSVPCIGVSQSCSNTMAIYGGCAVYVAQSGVYLDDGSGEVKISQALEPGTYSEGYGAVHGDKYYLSALRNGSERELLVYDLKRKLWHRESGSCFVDLVAARERLYGSTNDHDAYIWDLTGRRGEPEEEISWRVRTGDLMMDSPDRKYITRLTLRLELEPGSKLEIYARYDHEKQWQKLGMTYGRKLGSFSLPVRPRRCDHLQLELRGQGMGKVYSITKTLEEGSELP